MIHGLKQRIRAFLRAPEMEQELSDLRREGAEQDRLYARLQKDHAYWKRAFHAEEQSRRAAEAQAQKAREYAESQIPKEVAEWMQLCRHQDFPDDRAMIFYPSDLIRPVARLLQDGHAPTEEYQAVKLIPVRIHFSVNPESPFPCGVAARQLLQTIQKAVGEAVGQ